VPPQVEYALTPLGNSLAEQARQLGGWVEANLATLDANRAAFEAAQSRE
jgi:DNA-binding HxlR family transcriptional regulator